MFVSDRPRVAVAFNPRSHTWWSDGAREILDSFANWTEVRLELAGSSAGLEAAEALLICGWAGEGLGLLSGERLDTMPRLRFIASSSHYRQAEFIDLEAAAVREVTIVDTAPIIGQWVAEYELGLCLAALRNIPQDHAVVGDGRWVDFRALDEENDRLFGRKIGLASFGAIHREFVRLLAPFEADWEVFDPYVSADVIEQAGGRKADDLVGMASRSELLLVATPPTRETIGVVSREVIDALPRSALVVIVSRMSVVDQHALIDRLKAGEISAAVDVYDPEPPLPDSPLRCLPNVVHTPHRAGGTLAAHRAMFRGQCEEARRWFTGEPLRYRLRPELVALIDAEGGPPLDPPRPDR